MRNIIKTYETPFELNGKAHTATVTVGWGEEDESPEGNFDFGDETENANYLARFVSGELMLAYITVQVVFQGIAETDYLGMCHIKSNHIETDILDTVKFYQMEAVALESLKNNLNNLLKALA